MAIAPLVLTAALAAIAAAAPDAKALVAQLGSADPAVRAEATRALEALKRDALPALVEAIRGDDGDVRPRATAVWETIQRELVTHPSLVQLDGRHRPMADVLSDLQAQTGMTLRLNQPPPPNEVVALREPEPIPFWSALERLRLNSVFFGTAGLFGELPILDLRAEPGPRFVSADGPFRVLLTGLHWHRDRQLIGAPWLRIDQFGQRINAARDETDSERTNFYGDLQVMAEPRMWFTQEAPARLTEATDDRGQPLVPDPGGDEAKLSSGGHFPRYGDWGVTDLRTEFRLRLTDRPGRTASLRGVVPLLIHVRRPAPMLAIPLDGATGKTFTCDDVEFTIESVDHAPAGTVVNVTARLNVANAGLPGDRDPALIMSRMHVMSRHQIELVDAAGTVLSNSIASGSGGGSTPAVYRWTLNTVRKGSATHLRYFSMLRVPAEAAFAFRDVPLP